MSWSISLMGKPEKVVEALKAHSEKLNGQSKVEYDDALPNMLGIVQQNFGHETQLISVVANGHGSVNGEGKQLNRQVQMEIKAVYALLV